MLTDTYLRTAQKLKEVLDVEDVPPLYSFANMGGDSLDWVEFVWQLENEFKLDIDERSMLYEKGPDLAFCSLVDVLNEMRREPTPEIVAK